MPKNSQLPNGAFSLTKSRTHIVWLDVLRLIAIFMVLSIHATDNVPPSERSQSWYVLWGSVFGSFMRPSVPLFVMITGLLLIPVKHDMSMRQFYKKRLGRILAPFLIWAVFYNLFPWITGILGFKPEFINTFFAWAGESPSQTFTDAINRIALIPFKFNVYTTHLWYLYLLIGLYLYLPIFSAWVSRASKKDLELFLCIWGVSLLLPYAHEYLGKDLFGLCSWNAFGTFYYFAGFNGYLLLGYYLYHHNKMNWKQTLAVAMPLFIAGYLFTFIGFKSMVSDPNSTEYEVELFYTYCSLNVAMMTASVFLIVQKVKIKSERLKSLLSNLTKCGLGIYLSHYCFLGPIHSLTESLSLPVPVMMIIDPVLLLIVTWAFVAIVYKWSKAKWIMG
ncbi:acyltransferase [Aureibacter tunicatorum]|uniref:Surface polysaccharide O-acyltransferase-like enzyme n=1 Tax=Aureibacter tunicatorum TaxID=866807 RepID=A0AAE3XPT0_9BACT|nr:acyltransferase [Aureibacter tunicatorum]MDR6241821.1 surface polysaccharide O-acyltransferase-like enzyme [Aureibacter tunicatorum]BDD07068.1 hypothetical protein AUTU_45510 [Aureibacter tunicatorum]